MSRALMYSKSLQAVGIPKEQADAQVEMVLDLIESDMITKTDFALFNEKLDNRFKQIDSQFVQQEQKFELKLKEAEFRIVTRLGFLTVSTTSIAVAVLTWLIRIH